MWRFAALSSYDGQPEFNRTLNEFSDRATMILTGNEARKKT